MSGFSTIFAKIMRMNMKKFLLLAALIVAAVTANAQLLWKVSGNGAKDASYLFGTHHIAPVSLLDSISGLGSAICAVDAVVGEMDMAAATDPIAAQTIMMKYAMAPADSTLTRLLNVAQIDSLNAVLGKYTAGMMTVQMLDGLVPAMVNTQLALLQSQQAFPDFDATQQLDTQIQARASECGREVIGLETIEQQLMLLYGTPIAEQLAELLETIRKDEQAAPKAHELADAYLAGDLDAINALLVDPEQMDSEALDRLLIQRNNAWLEKISEWLPDKSMFIAVGVGHLVGQQGLIEQLRAKGYGVSPVSAN